MRPKASGLPTLTWPEIVDEVLCWGWIDSVRMPVDGGSSIRITPRRPGSIWSDRNVGRIEALRAADRMTPAGEAAFERRKADRTGGVLVRAGDRAGCGGRGARFERMRGLGLLGGAAGRLSAGRDALGDERQATRDAVETARAPGRRGASLGNGSPS